jgi:hypothetical protein
MTCVRFRMAEDSPRAREPLLAVSEGPEGRGLPPALVEAHLVDEEALLVAEEMRYGPGPLVTLWTGSLGDTG